VTVETKLALKIIVNGETLVTRAATLEELIAELGYGEARLATARNGDFIAARVRKLTRLKPGDKIEIVSPRHGG